MLNAGQGDSLVVRFPDNSWGVIDSNIPTGATDPAALSFLQGRSVDRLAFVCLTHPHADHFTGLERVFGYYGDRVDEFWIFSIDSAHLKKFLTVQHQKNATSRAGRRRYEELQNLFKIFCQMDKTGSGRRLIGGLQLPSRGGVAIDCLSPLSADVGEYQNHLTRCARPEEYKANENLLSCVLRFRYGNSTIVLSSDAPTKAWQRMWKEAGKRKESFEAEGVKISHHGSRQGFHAQVWRHLASSRGTSAVISAGVGYGHPDRLVIESLHEMGVRLHCTNFPALCLRREPRDLSKLHGLPQRAKLGLLMLDQSSHAPLLPCNGDIQFEIDADGTCIVHHQYDNFCPLHLPELNRGS
ncbi:MAG: ComEC/Rec2 family competence protein [Terriglobia bacterium]